MLDFTNASISSGTVEPKRETVKDILDNMGSILAELEHTINMISDAVYQGNTVAEEPKNEPCCDPPMIVMMTMQRDMAEDLLKKTVKIKEVLW